MFLRLLFESFRRQKRRKSVALLAIALGMSVGTAMIAVASGIGDKISRELRATGLRAELGDGSFRLKKSFEAANKVAHTIVILGEDEVASGILTVKHFASGEQSKVPRGELGQKLSALLGPPPTSTSN